ncbi:MAG: hypothetical protein IKQ51_08665 [Bacteroidaceae bacterium]|nr:hypothetical protein [Bacteroidaceae bacterium]
MSESKLPRGLRNNNPLNIRRSGDKWQGLRVLQEDREFFQFVSMEYGWRAAFVILCRTYYGKYKLRTIRDIVSRWAPAKENNTEAYIRHVSDYTGIGPDRDLGDPQTHPTNWLLIGYAMAVMENGKTLPPIPMIKGFALAVDS